MLGIFSMVLSKTLWRGLLWILTMAAMVLLHGWAGPTQGFAPLASITIPEALLLYLVPAALSVILGSGLITRT
jgi:hypothetical protein